MELSEINELSFDNIGEWPILIKILTIVVVIAAIVGGGYYYIIKDEYAKLDQAEKKEVSLRKQFEKKQAKAVNLNAYRQQLKEMEASFGVMLRQLPNKTQVAELLVDVSQTGLASGLEFELFQPLGEKKRDFYAELPIKLRVVGKYHQFGDFVSGLAALPRIVTVHNVRINRREGGKLVMEATAKTYRYLSGAAK